MVDARFRRHPAGTGVHRWAAAVLDALRPRVELCELAPRRGSGPAGHAWEQLVLPGRYRAERSGLPLLSPCNWGPLAVADQALVLHDVAPLVVPQHFSRAYVALARGQLPLLARRARTVLTVSQSARRDIVERLGVPELDVVVVGGGTRPLPPPEPPHPPLPECYFAFVGAHDARKNLSFLLDLWPLVHQATGAHLVVTRRPGNRTHTTPATGARPWCRELVDPTDGELAAVLTGARALLWPSVHEGFGLPLLEAYQLGVAVLSTDTGVAGEVVVAGDQVLPLDPRAWVDALVARVHAREGPTLPARRRAVAAGYGWDAVADRVLRALTR